MDDILADLELIVTSLAADNPEATLDMTANHGTIRVETIQAFDL